jgi:glutamate-5-semialdehyde dehydrogenase
LSTTELERDIATIASQARSASRALTKLSNEVRNAALRAIAGEIRRQGGAILAANERDIAAAEARGLTAALIDRLRLDPARLEGIAAAVDEVAAMPDLLGRLERSETRPNGLWVARMRIPLGVVLMIYEARPNVTADAAALCLKAGNAVILRGGSEAFASNCALGRAIATGLEMSGLPHHAVQVVGNTERASIELLLQHDAEIDLVIPRGGEGLIRMVAATSRIPVIKHYKGVCHVYVDAAADLDQALAIVANAKAQRPGVCNAAETVLIHRDIAEAFVPALVSRFRELGVEIRGDERVRKLGGTDVIAASEDDWRAEYLALIIAARVVQDLDEAVAHIETYGSDHTEAIVTRDAAAADKFVQQIQSSTVVVNASTRFADGGQLGLGAEIGISTTRLHAYGPMGAEGLTTTKFVVRGTGQIRT